MCGIYGSFNQSKFEVLEQANRSRGNFATGFCTITKDGSIYIVREKGVIDWEKIQLEVKYFYLGHNQAPTSKQRNWTQVTSHPFECGDWIIAHNGVLSNYKEIIKDYLPGHSNPVDSSVISALLHKFEQQDKSLTEVTVIKKVLELLKGTFAVWIVKRKTANVYLARQASTLFYDKNSFSSIKGENYKELKENNIYKITTKGVRSVGKFSNESPFLVL
jgi:glucosamine--fructose-6-phosphate aminotransferase (isomerizing)